MPTLRLNRAPVLLLCSSALALVGCPSSTPKPTGPSSVAEDPVEVEAPEPTTPDGAIISIDFRFAHGCTLSHGGDVRCWGKNVSGQVGDGTKEDRTDPVAAMSAARGQAIATGKDFACLLDGGDVRCWGNNEDGQLGDGTGVEPGALSLTPVSPSGLSSTAQIVLGEYHVCALSEGGSVKCWGNGADGQIGSDAERAFGTPRSIEKLGRVKMLASGSAHVCALETNGGVKCWGRHSEGQLGNAVSGSRLSPVKVTGLGDIAHIGSGLTHTCAVEEDGAVHCWGDNKAKQLGPEAGDAGRSKAAVEVPGIDDALEVAGGDAHTCARVRGGRVLCWGNNDEGQLGDGSTKASTKPVEVEGVRGAVGLALGTGRSCAWLDDGSARCWGADEATFAVE